MKSSLNLTASTPIHKEEMTKLITLWQSLQDHNDSLFFRMPVDIKRFTDYPYYVKIPMDLSTVNRKLREQRYKTVEEVLDDLQLIWDNCRAYNPENTGIYSISIKMDKVFKNMVKSYLPQIDLSPPQPNRPPRTQLPIPAEQQFGIFPQQEVAYLCKINLIERMKLLTPPCMKQLTNYIAQVCPNAFVEDGNNARILVDSIDAESFPLIKEKLQQILSTNRILLKKLKLF